MLEMGAKAAWIVALRPVEIKTAFRRPCKKSFTFSCKSVIQRGMAQLKHPKMVDIRDILDENTRLPALVAASAEKLLGLERLNKAYDKIVRDKESGSPENFFQLASRHLNLKLQLRPGDLENIPKKGPVVVVANHPHGLSDGIMFGELLTRVREDVRILANEQLSLCQELEPWLIKVDVYEDENAKRKNLSGMRKMISWLRKGGVLGIFPAGTASSFSLAHKRVTDDPWNANIAAIIRMTKATVVPVHFPGRNSLLFQGRFPHQPQGASGFPSP